jgi:putative CocE/NonD family hydrolase
MKPYRAFSLTIVVLLAIVCSIPARAHAQLTPQQQELADYIKSNYTKREVMIPVRDGVKLFTAIYEPKDRSQKYPIMLFRTPYSVAPYGADKFKNSLGPDELFAREGYIFAYQDVRGRLMSEGEFEDVRPYIPNKTGKQIDETSDAYDTVEWLVKNVQNNNGRVGVWGISYPGFYTSMAGIDSHPAIKAISPQAPIADWFKGDDMHHNGALFLAQNYAFFTFMGQPRPGPVSSFEYLKDFKWGTPDGYKFFLDMGGLNNSGEIYQKRLGTRSKFWDQMMAHPNYDQFWKERNVLPNLKNIKAAVMTVGGWYDDEDLYGALTTYQYIERQNPGIFNVLVMGPWFHGGWVRSEGDWLGTAYFGQKTGRYYQEKFELPFFNHFLKDKGDISQIKEVNTFDTGANEWRDFNAWEPKVVTDTPLYLAAGGRLSFTDAVGKGGRADYDEYVSDPFKPVPYTQKITINYPKEFMTEDQRFVSSRTDVLVYQTEPLTEDITIAGDIKPQIIVASSGTDSDFVVKLIDVFPGDYEYPKGIKLPEDAAGFQPGGYQMLLRGEPFPARFRKSFENPEPLEPNRPAKISFVMPGVVHTFKKGHRIMVHIQSTWFPLVARNPQKFVPNYKQAGDADFQKATQRVYRGGANISSIILPIVKR